jgi:hypothetical protein
VTRHFFVGSAARSGGRSIGTAVVRAPKFAVLCPLVLLWVLVVRRASQEVVNIELQCSAYAGCIRRGAGPSCGNSVTSGS